MKFILLSLLLTGLLAVSWADVKSEVTAITKSCEAETKTTTKEAEDFWQPSVNYDSVTPNMKCFVKCVMEGLGHLKGGVLDVEKTVKDWKEAPAEFSESKKADPKYFNQCKNEKGANDCETAFNIIKCVRQAKA